MPSASINQRPGELRVRWRDPDGTQRTRTFRHAVYGARQARELAHTLLAEVREDLALGRPWTPRVARAAPLLEDVMAAYVADRARVLRASTAANTARALELFLRCVGLGARVDVLSRATLATFHSWLMDPATGLHGHQRSTTTANKIVAIAQRLWAFAADHDDFGVYVARARKIEMAPTVAPTTVAPTWSEMAACIAAANGWHRRLATVLYATGLRCNQAMALLWSDLDLEARTLRVRPELGKTTSESRGRIVPLAPWFAAELTGWGVRTGYVVPSGRSTGPRERVARDRDMRAAWVRAGVREEAWRGRPHHAFRKGFATGLKRAGADSEAVEYLLGHSQGLRGVYVDPTALPLVAAVEMVPSPASVPTLLAQVRR